MKYLLSAVFVSCMVFSASEGSASSDDVFESEGTVPSDYSNNELVFLDDSFIQFAQNVIDGGYDVAICKELDIEAVISDLGRRLDTVDSYLEGALEYYEAGADEATDETLEIINEDLAEVRHLISGDVNRAVLDEVADYLKNCSEALGSLL